jgi:ElaB/YqjD/DUF883 family membrane-anchored ribosome-binding protein
MSESIHDEVDALKGAVVSIADKVRTTSRERSDEVLDQAKKHPVKAMGIAAGVGLILGLLIRKK